MGNIDSVKYKKFQVTIHFDMDDEFMTLVPPHRVYINQLINKEIIDYYSVSMESRRSWIIINAERKIDVQRILSQSPLFKYWTIEIDELFVFDGLTYRLPALRLN
jgi:muconolactone delta-isomerase